jgi:hypothetical protein
MDGSGIESRWGGRVFPHPPDRPWDPPVLLYDGYRLSLPGVKRPERGLDRPPLSIANVKERAPLYVFSPVGPSWPVMGWTFYLCVIDIRSRACVMTFVTGHCFRVVPDGVGSKVLWNVGIRVPDHTAAVFSITVVQPMVSCHNSSYNLVHRLRRQSFKTISVDSLSFNILIGIQYSARWPRDKLRSRSSTWKFGIALWSITVLMLTLPVFTSYLLSFPLSFNLSLRRPGFDPRQVRVGAVVSKVMMGTGFLRLFLFSPVSINPSTFPIRLFACRLR